MLSRREFLAGSSALALTPLVERILEHHVHSEEPLLVSPPRVKRVFYIDRGPDHPGYQVVTDALDFPRRLVTFEAIERDFGRGSFRKLTQRDHWRLIDEGRFSKEETFQPCFGDGFYTAWAANHSPSSEAVQLLGDVGLGPDHAEDGMCGLAFLNCDDEDGRLPSVYCETPEAISLLQAALIEKKAHIEVRFEARSFTHVPWQDFLRNGGNVEGV